jgi:hypothetical protein
MEILKSGATGKQSSKRLFGSIFLSTGGLMLIFGGIVSMKITFADPEMFKFCAKTLVFVGAGLLGLGIVDGIGKKIREGK